MTRLIILLGLFCLPWSAYAHQPDLSSTILAEKEQGQWVLQVRASLTAFDYEVEAHYGESAYATPEEFRALVVKYLSEELNVRFNGGKAVVLEDGVVKLGHETTVTFQLASPPADVQSLKLSNTGFRHINNNQSAFYVAKAGLDKKQVMLNSDNGYTAELLIDDGQFVAATPAGISAFLLPVLLLLGGLTVLALAYRAYGRKQDDMPLIFTLN